MKLTVTPAAVKQALKVRPTFCNFLRLSVHGGGCSGLSYKMEWIEVNVLNTLHDNYMKFGDLNVIVDPKSLKFLDGVVLDLETNDFGHRFVFNNPNATRECGCGKSFS